MVKNDSGGQNTISETEQHARQLVNLKQTKIRTKKKKKKENFFFQKKKKESLRTINYTFQKNGKRLIEK